VVRRWRDQQRRRAGGAQEGQEVDVLLQVGHAPEALGEGHPEQEREENLDARERDPQLVQELDQLPVETFILALALGHRESFPAEA